MIVASECLSISGKNQIPLEEMCIKIGLLETFDERIEYKHERVYHWFLGFDGIKSVVWMRAVANCENF